MAENAMLVAQMCIFCAIAARQHEASLVYEDEIVVAFMDRYPVTPGHVLVVPRQHVVGLEDLDGPTGAAVWSVGHRIARALRRSSLDCEGINVLVCDGEVAFQTVFHFHLHVIPRYAAAIALSVPLTGVCTGPDARDRSVAQLRQPGDYMVHIVPSTPMVSAHAALRASLPDGSDKPLPNPQVFVIR